MSFSLFEMFCNPLNAVLLCFSHTSLISTRWFHTYHMHSIETFNIELCGLKDMCGWSYYMTIKVSTENWWLSYSAVTPVALSCPSPDSLQMCAISNPPLPLSSVPCPHPKAQWSPNSHTMSFKEICFPTAGNARLLLWMLKLLKMIKCSIS